MKPATFVTCINVITALIIYLTLYLTEVDYHSKARLTIRRSVDRSPAGAREKTAASPLLDLQLDYEGEQYLQDRPERQALVLIHGPVRLSSHVIEHGPTSFSSQMVGRLLPHQELPGKRQFTESMIRAAPRPWLQPLTAELAPSGGRLFSIRVELRRRGGDAGRKWVFPGSRRCLSCSGVILRA